MLLADSVQVYLGYFVAFIMGTGVLANLIGPAPIREGYARWGYPPGFRFVTALLEGTAAILILLEPTRAIGLLLGATIMLAAVITLVRSGEYLHSPPAVLVLIASVLALL